MSGLTEIFIDIETIPSQRDEVLSDIEDEVRKGFDAKRKEIEAAIANVRPPASLKDPEKIEAAIAAKRSALLDELASQGVAEDAALDKAVRDTALNGGYGQVFCAVIAIDDEEPTEIWSESWRLADAERNLLQSINDFIRDVRRVTPAVRLIGHNVLDFDRTFLRQRGIVNGVMMDRCISAPVKPWEDAVQDTMILWTGSPAKRISLDRLGRILGLGGKADGMDGSKVWDYVRAGRLQEVVDYCRRDVELTRAIYRKLTGGAHAIS